MQIPENEADLDEWPPPRVGLAGGLRTILLYLGVVGALLLVLVAIAGCLTGWGGFVLVLLKVVGVEMSATYEQLAVATLGGFGVQFFCNMIGRGVTGRG